MAFNKLPNINADTPLVFGPIKPVVPLSVSLELDNCPSWKKARDEWIKNCFEEKFAKVMQNLDEK